MSLKRQHVGKGGQRLIKLLKNLLECSKLSTDLDKKNVMMQFQLTL